MPRWALTHMQRLQPPVFALPFMAGAAALLAQRGLTNVQIAARLETTATDLGTPGQDLVYGFGKVNAARAVGAAT